jgi:hypothetical protein
MTPPGNSWRMVASLDYSYVDAGDISFQGINGSSDTQSFNAGITAEIPVNDQWFVSVSIGSRSLLLGTIAGAPIPDRVEMLGFDAGVDYRFNEVDVRGQRGPQFCRLIHIAYLLQNYNRVFNLTICLRDRHHQKADGGPCQTAW